MNMIHRVSRDEEKTRKVEVGPFGPASTQREGMLSRVYIFP